MAERLKHDGCYCGCPPWSDGTWGTADPCKCPCHDSPPLDLDKIKMVAGGVSMIEILPLEDEQREEQS